MGEKFLKKIFVHICFILSNWVQLHAAIKFTAIEIDKAQISDI